MCIRDSDNAIIAWDESEDKFIVGTTTATASDTGNLSITTGTLVGNIEGNLTGNVTGNVSGSSGSTTGNAATATTAAALTTGRTIGMTGDVVWTSASFDGSGNVTLQTQDLDGDGPNAPDITVSGNLKSGVLYNGAIVLLNETESPAENVTMEIEEEDKSECSKTSLSKSDKILLMSDAVNHTEIPFNAT